MMFEDRVNLLTEKVINRLLEFSGHEPHFSERNYNPKYVYHCANQSTLPKLFKFGFERYFVGKGVGTMYGQGVYTTTDFESSRKNAERGLYGRAIVRAEVQSYKDFLIWEPVIAKIIYGKNWKMEDQLNIVCPEYVERMKQLGVVGEFDDGSRSLYDFVIKPRERSSVAAREIYANKKNGSPYDKIKGFIFYGSSDGHVAVIMDVKNLIPYQYSLDFGKTWINGQTEDTFRYTKNDFDVQLSHGKKYDKTTPPEFGWAKVEKNGKINYVDKDGNEMTTTWFNGGSNFTDIEGFVAAQVAYNGTLYFLSKDADIYESLEDDGYLCTADELPQYV